VAVLGREQITHSDLPIPRTPGGGLAHAASGRGAGILAAARSSIWPMMPTISSISHDDAGITFVATADFWSAGGSEVTVGKALAWARD